jgi:hypothetical protein
MFGLKLIKKEDYSVLEYQLEKAQSLLDEKDCEIKTLNSRIQDLENTVRDLLRKVSDSSTPDAKPENVVLLSDVAETSLVEEKSVKKPRRTVKKTEGVKTPRKKVVKKTEE